MKIYKITNNITKKVYIGQTIRSVESRWWGHKSRSRSTSGKYGARSHLYNSMRKHGIENFSIETIDSAETIEELNRKEEEWIRKYNSVEKGYNILKGATENPMDNLTVQEKHRERMKSKEVRSRISATMLRYRAENPIKQETLDKLSYRSKTAWKEGRMPESIMTPEIQAMAAESRRRKTKIEILDENIVKEFRSMRESCEWLLNNGYFGNIRWRTLASYAKKSNESGEPYRGVRWTY